jgi:adenosine deaminase
VQHGIPVTLATDLPLHVCTTIGREYSIASKLAFSPDDLRSFTRNAVAASFTTPARRAALLRELET